MLFQNTFVARNRDSSTRESARTRCPTRGRCPTHTPTRCSARFRAVRPSDAARRRGRWPISRTRPMSKVQQPDSAARCASPVQPFFSRCGQSVGMLCRLLRYDMRVACQIRLSRGLEQAKSARGRNIRMEEQAAQVVQSRLAGKAGHFHVLKAVIDETAPAKFPSPAPLQMYSSV